MLKFTPKIKHTETNPVSVKSGKMSEIEIGLLFMEERENRGSLYAVFESAAQRDVYIVYIKLSHNLRGNCLCPPASVILSTSSKACL